MPPQSPSNRRSAPDPFVLILGVLAGIVLIADLVGVVLLAVDYAAEEAPARTIYLASLQLLLPGLIASALLGGLALGLYAVKRAKSPGEDEVPKDDTPAEDGGRVAQTATTPGNPTAVEDGSRAMQDEMLQLLREIAENSLLSDNQREEKQKQRRADEERSLAEQVDRLIGQGEFRRAEEICEQMAGTFGAQAERLRKEIEQARKQAEHQDIEDARQKVTDLMSLAAWDQVEDITKTLWNRYPGSEGVQQMVDFVHRERTTYEKQQRQRMFADIERHVGHRRWDQAHEAAKRFVERYGDTPEAKLVRSRLDTLRANAEVAERQTMAEEIKDLVRKHRFDEAVQLARRVIQTYPDSPQAEVLKNQLPRLETKAKSL